MPISTSRTVSHPSTIERHTLSNGVRVIVEPIPSMRSVAVGVWVHVGSRDEHDENGGITHLIEHMVFKGTERRRTHHIAQRMESVGGYLNAFTSKEHTCYYARGLDEHFSRALDVVADLVATPKFPEGELEKEKEVVVEEMRMYEDQPEDLIYGITAALWNDSTRKLLDAGHQKGKVITLDTALDGVGIPLHAGAEKFYKEAGLLK